MSARQFWMGIAITLALGCIAVGILLMAGCAPVNTRLSRADMTPTQLAQPIVQQTLDAQDESDKRNARFMYGCQGADFATTGIGLAVGLAEANPLGLLTIPIALIAERIVQHNANKTGGYGAERTVGAVHCGAAAINILTIL